MDTEDHDKDPNAVLQSLLSSDNSKNADFQKSVGAEPSVPDVPIVHVYNEEMAVYTTDGSGLQQTVDSDSLQWQNLERNGYSVGDTLLWDGTVQVDQIDNLHSLEVLNTSSDGELKKTEMYCDVPVSISNALQNPVLTLDNISTLNSSTTYSNNSCIPSTSQISIDSPPSNVPLPVLDMQTFPAPLQKSSPARKKKLPSKPSPKPGGKKAKKLKTLPKVKGSSGKAVALQPEPGVSSLNLLQTSNQDSIKKKVSQDYLNPTKLEDNPSQVQDRFNLGCECQDSNCFDTLTPDSVFRHRLNIAELTKAEHDMYLMGVTMACLGNPEHTNRNKERQRLRAKYVYRGRHVCLQAFLYLENCTLYQVKRIRKHVMMNGVVPRIHGNHGKKPHNRFPLELYCHATDFLKRYLRPYNVDRDVSKTTPLFLGPDVTRKSVHQAYLNFCESEKPDEKVMGYSTFRHFMKEQFPYIRFRPLDVPGIGRETSKHYQQHPRIQGIQNNPDHTQRTQTQKRAQTLSRAHLKKEDTQAKQNRADFKMIALTEVVIDDQTETIEQSPDLDVIEDNSLTESGNVVLLNSSVPLMAGSNFVMVTSDSFPQFKEENVLIPGGSGNKTTTINSSSLRLVSANGMSASSLVPMKTLAMLGPGVFPIYLDTKAQPEQIELIDRANTQQTSVENAKTLDSQDVDVRSQKDS